MELEPQFFTVWEASVFFATSERSIRRMVADGQLEHVRIRGAIRIPKPRPGYSPLRPTGAVASAA